MRRPYLALAGLALLAAVFALRLDAGLARLSAAAFTDHSGGASTALTSGSWTSLQAVQDAWADQENPATNFGTDTTMSVEAVTAVLAHQAFAQFDLSSIPGGATVESARLRLCDTGSIGTALDHTLELVGDTWDEGTIDWDTRPAVVSDPAPLTIALGVTAGATCFETDVKPHVEAWLDGVLDNNGWRVSTDDIGIPVDYATHEHTDEALRPELTISYTPQTSRLLAHRAALD
jgi:hypothetical protein